MSICSAGLLDQKHYVYLFVVLACWTKNVKYIVCGAGLLDQSLRMSLFVVLACWTNHTE